MTAAKVILRLSAMLVLSADDPLQERRKPTCVPGTTEKAHLDRNAQHQQPGGQHPDYRRRFCLPGSLSADANQRSRGRDRVRFPYHAPQERSDRRSRHLPRYSRAVLWDQRCSPGHPKSIQGRPRRPSPSRNFAPSAPPCLHGFAQCHAASRAPRRNRKRSFARVPAT